MEVKTREAQYGVCFNEKPITLGPMASHTYRHDPRRLGIVLARYKFVAKMLSRLECVAEIGCADGFASPVVAQEVGALSLFDFDPSWNVPCLDIVQGPLPNTWRGTRWDGIYMIDVLEHIDPKNEYAALGNIVHSLQPHGVFIAGMPSLESQAHASPQSKVGHVNCKTAEDLRSLMQQHFRNVFLLGMNDEVLHTGFGPMCHYLFVLCTGPHAVRI